MNIDERMDLIVRDTIEVVTKNELKQLLESQDRPKAYWGYECSGFIHIGMGLITGRKIIDAVNAGLDFIIFLADWHSWINNKLGGKMENIRLAGEYFKHGFTAIGVPRDKVTYLWADDIVSDKHYWELVIRIGKSASLRRVLRSLPIIGRKESEEINEFAWLIYPLMQVADIFTMGLDVVFAGIDQRKAHMLARDVAKPLGYKSPVSIHVPLLPSLDIPVPRAKDEKIYTKMSKSRPETVITIHDEEEAVKKKIMKAYCPPKDVVTNPLFYLLRYIIFPYLRDSDGQFIVKTKSGEKVYNTLTVLESDYLNGSIHPLDLKLSIIDNLNDILNPIRRYFDKHSGILNEMRKIVEEERLR
jgi:tyrosyl-tRNA synthetase